MQKLVLSCGQTDNFRVQQQGSFQFINEKLLIVSQSANHKCETRLISCGKSKFYVSENKSDCSIELDQTQIIEEQTNYLLSTYLFWT